MTDDTPRFCLRLDPEIRRSLEEMAKAQGVTLSDVIRQAIMDFIDKNKTDA